MKAKKVEKLFFEVCLFPQQIASPRASLRHFLQRTFLRNGLLRMISCNQILNNSVELTQL